MSEDPIRWRDDADAPPGARDLLDTLDAPPPMPEAVRARGRAALPARSFSLGWWATVGVAAAAALVVAAWVWQAQKERSTHEAVAQEPIIAEPVADEPARVEPEETEPTTEPSLAPAPAPAGRAPVEAEDPLRARARAMVAAARAEFENGDLEDARRLARAALELTPEDREAWTVLAEVHASRGEAAEERTARLRARGLSAEQVARLDRLARGPDPTLPSDPADTRRELPSTPDASGVRRVISRYRDGLQRCYDRAVRGRDVRDSVRFDVSLRIAPSGAVERVEAIARSDGWRELGRCLENSIRMWEFPPSRSGGAIRFPIVFAGER